MFVKLNDCFFTFIIKISYKTEKCNVNKRRNLSDKPYRQKLSIYQHETQNQLTRTNLVDFHLGT